MIIQDGKLLFVDAGDLDTNGTIRIPDGVVELVENIGNAIPGLRRLYIPDSLKEIKACAFCNNQELDTVYLGEGLTKINNSAFVNCDNIQILQIPSSWIQIMPFMPCVGIKLNTIVRKNGDGCVVKYPIRQYRGRHYYETARRCIRGITIISLQSLKFDANGICGQPHTAICVANHTFVRPHAADAINDARKTAMLFEFKYAIWRHNAADAPECNLNTEDLLVNAAEKTLRQISRPTMRDRRAMRKYATQIPMFIKYINKFLEKYSSMKSATELHMTTLGEMQQIIFPCAKNPVGKSATRLLKKRPVTTSELNAMFIAGYQNPGAMPYSWIRDIEKSQRGQTTKKIHAIMRNAATKLYSPTSSDDIFANSDTLNQMARRISKLIRRPVKIQYLNSGNFAKAYKIMVDGAPDYVWKIYHSNREYEYVKNWGHDNELQNSFLASGKKYYGDVRFRKIATAGISSQRGERYLLYPFANGVAQPLPDDPYGCLKKFRIYDLENDSNRIGNTIIDCGAMRMHPIRWDGPYMTKIINTVIYRPWDDLATVLHKYTNYQISIATQFIDKHLSTTMPHYARIRAKIDFLNNKIRARGGM